MRAVLICGLVALFACGGGENEEDTEPRVAVPLSTCEAPLAPEFGDRGSVTAGGLAVFEDATSDVVSEYWADITLHEGGAAGDKVTEHVVTAERLATHVFPGDSGGWHVPNLRVEFDVSGGSMRLSQVGTMLTRNITCAP